MSTKPTTCVAIVLDKSSSMSGTKEQTAIGYNEHIQQIRLNAERQEIKFCLVTFNGEVFEHLWLESADKLKEVTENDLETVGSTALRDALGYTIQKLSKTAPKGDDVSFLVIVISDGEENSSQHITPGALQELVKERQGRGNWTFTYMGCSEEYVNKVAKETAIPVTNCAVWDNRSAHRTRKGMTSSSEKLGAYFCARATGQSASESYHSSVKGAAANYVDDGPDDVQQAVVDHNAVQQAAVNYNAVPSQIPLNNFANNFARVGRKPMLADSQQHLVQSIGTGAFANSSAAKWEV